jgi:hypothetical protein
VSRLYRQLFRIVANWPRDRIVWVVCPGWDSGVRIPLSYERVPEFVHTQKVGYRFYAQCDLNCVDVPTMQKSIQSFEPAPEPDPNDGLA